MFNQFLLVYSSARVGLMYLPGQPYAAASWAKKADGAENCNISTHTANFWQRKLCSKF